MINEPRMPPADRTEVKKLAKAVEEALAEEMRTSFRSDNPDLPSWEDGSRIGNTPPVDQPGRPSMSKKAVDDSVRMWSFGGMTALVCGGISLVMVASDRADPTAVGTFFGGLAVLALAIARLLRRAKDVAEAAPPEINNTYTGTVYQDQRNVQNKNTAVWVKNTNNP